MMPGAVDCATLELRRPSPAALVALTSNVYSVPAPSPATIADISSEPYVPTTSVTAEPTTPVSRYSVYALTTAAPVPLLGAAHDT